jgi:ABC-type sugar transport system permease subunit
MWQRIDRFLSEPRNFIRCVVVVIGMSVAFGFVLAGMHDKQRVRGERLIFTVLP